MSDLLDAIRAQPLPFAELLGIEYVEVTKERVVAELLVREDLCTRPAILHGGAVMAFADTLGAVATVVNLPPNTTTTTIESKTNFIGPAPAGQKVVGETTPIHRGRRTMVWQTKISSKETGKTVAVVTQSQMVLEGK